MSYRIHEKPKPLARRSVESIATPFRVWVTNGTSTEVAIPCFYQEIRPPMPAVHHDVHWHHHIGWPSPHHPDHICQMAYKPHECGRRHCDKTCRHYLDPRTIIPIHFDKEPYGEFWIAFTDENGNTFESNESIDAEVWVDNWEDWVVRIMFHTSDADAILEPKKYLFTIYGRSAESIETKIDALTGTEKTRVIPARTDAICLGQLVILPASWNADSSANL